jgi:hypothetical protein
MNALEALFAKQESGAELTALEQVILDTFYRGGTALLAWVAANELAHMQERIKEHLPR